MISRLIDPRWLHPEGYHGGDQRSPYFEGWYFKIVDLTTRHRYAIIPGISLSTTGDEPHSFVQVLEDASGKAIYQRYGVNEFAADERGVNVRVGPNSFTWDRMHIELDHGDLSLHGDVRFLGARPWPVTPTSPGIMDWYTWVPRMECYHGVLSLDHGLSGTLTADGTSIDFAKGRGYIEKDWGKSFPSGWIWMQSNHFATPGVSLTASIAMIPWIGRAFPGFIVGLLLDETLYRFATYTGATTTHLSLTEDAVIWRMQDALYVLDIVAHHADAGKLRGPSRHDMGRPVPETLSARVDLTLRARASDTIIYSGTGACAGLEIGGNTTPLLQNE